MEELKWRFPASNHGTTKGISSGDAEAFKKQPYEAFAREILQNSVDAAFSDEEPVKVIFKTFEMKVSDIPGLEDLKIAVRRAKEFWNYKKDYIEYCEKIENELEKDKINCLRISDYNTTGLIGVESNEQNNNHFLALTKGSGVSVKNNKLSGGSKGVGKNAAFIMSKVQTVFYSTYTSEDINKNKNSFKGYIGVSNLISGYVDDDIENTNRDYTQGNGYFCIDDNNNPVLDSLIDIDNAKKDRDNSFGTDIFVLGFRDNDSWVQDVINSILDSFISTIYRNKLEVEFNEILINKDTLEDIVYSDYITEKNKKNIISQYRLLKGGNDVIVYDIDTEYGSCELYILPYSKQEEALATHKCAMIRHPLMKIKDYNFGGNYRASAMCIIPDNVLGQMLSQIENPQYIDWEPKRIIDDKVKRKEYTNLLHSIYNEIFNKVIECLKTDGSDPLDPNGAGDYLPDIEIGDSKGESADSGTVSEKTKISKVKVNKPIEKDANQESGIGFGIQPDIGSIEEDEDGDVTYPTGTNHGNGKEPHEGPENGRKTEGDTQIVTRSFLTGIRYRVISIDKNLGKLRIVFSAPVNRDDCYLKISLLDDRNSPSKVEILNMTCNSKIIESEDKIEYGPFSIESNKKIVLDVQVDKKGFFGSEVKVICK